MWQQRRREIMLGAPRRYHGSRHCTSRNSQCLSDAGCGPIRKLRDSDAPLTTCRAPSRLRCVKPFCPSWSASTRTGSLLSPSTRGAAVSKTDIVAARHNSLPTCCRPSDIRSPKAMTQRSSRKAARGSCDDRNRSHLYTHISHAQQASTLRSGPLDGAPRGTLSSRSFGQEDCLSMPL
jgi:hypothetical protein